MPALFSGHFLFVFTLSFMQTIFTKKSITAKATRKAIPGAALLTALIFMLSAANTTVVMANTDESPASHRKLSNNECLKKLDNSDLVIASIAFKDGLNSSAQIKELLKRKPWGAGTADTDDEIKAQLDTQSPFLIITLTKEQALTLDNHRDIIRWILVQSTSKPCE